MTGRKTTTTLFTCLSQGLDDLRKTILEAAVDPFSFPHCSSTVRPSTVALYDHILALRERDVVVLPWQQFQETTCWDSSDAGGESFDAEDFDYLEAVVSIPSEARPCALYNTSMYSVVQYSTAQDNTFCSAGRKIMFVNLMCS